MVKLTVSSFEFSTIAYIIKGYEGGQGYMNIPDKSIHTCIEIYEDYTSYVPDTLPETPYIGYGWYLRKLKNITIHEKIDVDHLMQNVKPEDIENIYVVFSKRLSQIARPCVQSRPIYIGYCRKHT
jgi:hypothetical protein